MTNCFEQKWYCKYFFDLTISLLFLPCIRLIGISFIFVSFFLKRVHTVSTKGCSFQQCVRVLFSLHPYQHSLLVDWGPEHLTLQLVRLREVSLIYTTSFGAVRATLWDAVSKQQQINKTKFWNRNEMNKVHTLWPDMWTWEVSWEKRLSLIKENSRQTWEVVHLLWYTLFISLAAFSTHLTVTHSTLIREVFLSA